MFDSDPRVVRRTGALLLAVAQLLVFAVVPVADAMLDADAFVDGVHVEAQGSEHCATHHDHLFCQVFRSFSAAIGAGNAPVALLRDPAPVVAETPPESVRQVASPEDSGPLGSRAPPLG